MTSAPISSGCAIPAHESAQPPRCQEAEDHHIEQIVTQACLAYDAFVASHAERSTARPVAQPAPAVHRSCLTRAWWPVPTATPAGGPPGEPPRAPLASYHHQAATLALLAGMPDRVLEHMDALESLDNEHAAARSAELRAFCAFVLDDLATLTDCMSQPMTASASAGHRALQAVASCRAAKQDSLATAAAVRQVLRETKVDADDLVAPFVRAWANAQTYSTVQDITAAFARLPEPLLQTPLASYLCVRVMLQKPGTRATGEQRLAAWQRNEAGRTRHFFRTDHFDFVLKESLGSSDDRMRTRAADASLRAMANQCRLALRVAHPQQEAILKDALSSLQQDEAQRPAHIAAVQARLEAQAGLQPELQLAQALLHLSQHGSNATQLGVVVQQLNDLEHQLRADKGSAGSNLTAQAARILMHAEQADASFEQQPWCRHAASWEQARRVDIGPEATVVQKQAVLCVGLAHAAALHAPTTPPEHVSEYQAVMTRVGEAAFALLPDTLRLSTSDRVQLFDAVAQQLAAPHEPSLRLYAAAHEAASQLAMVLQHTDNSHANKSILQELHARIEAHIHTAQEQARNQAPRTRPALQAAVHEASTRWEALLQTDDAHFSPPDVCHANSLVKAAGALPSAPETAQALIWRARILGHSGASLAATRDLQRVQGLLSGMLQSADKKSLLQGIAAAEQTITNVPSTPLAKLQHRLVYWGVCHPNAQVALRVAASVAAGAAVIAASIHLGAPVLPALAVAFFQMLRRGDLTQLLGKETMARYQKVFIDFLDDARGAYRTARRVA